MHSLQLPPLLAIASKSQQPKGCNSTLSIMNVAIDTLNILKEISSITPANAIWFGLRPPDYD